MSPYLLSRGDADLPRSITDSKSISVGLFDRRWDGEADRIVAVIPLAKSDSEVQYSSLSCRRCTPSRCGARLLMAVLC